MAIYQGYGNPPTRNGKLAADRGSIVPLKMLNNLVQYPIPITIGGSNNVTFTLKGSTRPIPVWAGDDLILLEEDLAYTWDNTSNDILDANGDNATDTDSVLGVWYFYIAITLDSNGAWQYELRPSQTAPEATEGPNNSGYLGHPGTSKDYYWRYVGFHVCTTAATPAFMAATKIGYWYKFAEVDAVIPTASWAAPTNLTLYIPQLAKFGLEVQGTVETGSNSSVHIGSSSSSTQWDVEFSVTETTASNVAEQTAHAPFRLAPNDTTSPIYGIATNNAGDIHLTGVKDIV